jgi:hypothetical protein
MGRRSKMGKRMIAYKSVQSKAKHEEQMGPSSQTQACQTSPLAQASPEPTQIALPPLDVQACEEPAVSDIQRLGKDYGRDLFLVVEDTAFHVHSAIIYIFLRGEVFDGLVEQAYLNPRREVTLYDDCPNAWSMLLRWMYNTADNTGFPMSSWEFRDALAVAPLVHKYDAASIQPTLSEALASNKPEARKLRSVEVANKLVPLHMEAVIESWFSDMPWATYEIISSFLNDTTDEMVLKAALSCAWNLVNSADWTELPPGHPDRNTDSLLLLQATAMVNKIAKLLPVLTPDACELATAFLSNISTEFARTPGLATAINNAGFSQVIVTWFQDKRWWPIEPNLVADLNTFTEDLVLAIAQRITDELKATRVWRDADKAKALIRAVVVKLRTIAWPSCDQNSIAWLGHCNASHNRQETIMREVGQLLDAIPTSRRDAEIAVWLADYGFCFFVLKWVETMPLNAVQEILTMSNQDLFARMELTRAALARDLRETKLLQEAQKKLEEDQKKKQKKQENTIQDLRTELRIEKQQSERQFKLLQESVKKLEEQLKAQKRTNDDTRSEHYAWSRAHKSDFYRMEGQSTPSSSEESLGEREEDGEELVQEERVFRGKKKEEEEDIEIHEQGSYTEDFW